MSRTIKDHQHHSKSNRHLQVGLPPLQWPEICKKKMALSFQARARQMVDKGFIEGFHGVRIK